MASSNAACDQLFTSGVAGTKNDPQRAQATEVSDDNYILIDICANLVNKKFNRDLESVIQRAKDAGVKKMIVLGTSAHTTKEALRLTRMHPGTVYCTAGVHPHDAKSWDEDALEVLRSVALSPECVGIGECGLDFSKNFSSPECQIQVLEKQMALACELNKPLVLRERAAFDAMMDVLARHSSRLPAHVVLHCFAGSSDQAAAYLARGCYLGVGGQLWKEPEVLRSVPPERLLLESDSPFLWPNARALPSPWRTALQPRAVQLLERYCSFQRNEPCCLPAVLELTAAVLGLGPQDLALRTTYTALSIFGLD
ncbi:3'-5' ssDNA/RNA exonuclease TatD-like [Dermacentor andersoni]|uniref:3'-5' ssDNA/RNA exonuclease TatD-like n=1 Tax=Dermacentor andersoni TaxID=34620 RepID=UPI0021555B67|nr:3'-5' ssDNA/RNA exonuclease TatD-like [Dermacentor andersoni]